MTLKQRINAYIHHLNDADYVRSIFASSDVATVSAALAEILRGGDRAETSYALLFVNDVATQHTVPAFREHLTKSGILDILRDNLYIWDFHIRLNTIRTLGKMGPRSSAQMLAKAFPHYLERDPPLVPDLLFELLWLSRDQRRRRWKYIRAVIESPQYLVRWSALDPLDRVGLLRDSPDEEKQQAERYCEPLAADEHPFVRAEASHVLSAMRAFRERGFRLGEYGEFLANHARTEPTPTFFRLHLGIWNYLGIERIPDYDLDMADAFAHYLHEHPTRAGIDLQAYAGAFTASRRATEPG